MKTEELTELSIAIIENNQINHQLLDDALSSKTNMSALKEDLLLQTMITTHLKSENIGRINQHSQLAKAVMSRIQKEQRVESSWKDVVHKTIRNGALVISTSTLTALMATTISFVWTPAQANSYTQTSYKLGNSHLEMIQLG